MPGCTPNRPWVVQKYGGTSIGKLLETITGTIIPNYLASNRVLVVCSARSGTVKSKGTTSLLIEAIRCATSSETSTTQLDQVIDTIRDEHFLAAQNAIQEDGMRESLLNEIRNDCENLRSFLKATWTIGEITDRTQDRVLAVGEKLSCRIVAASLANKGIASEVVLLDDVVQQVHKTSVREQRAFFRRHPSRFLRSLAAGIETRILQCEDRVPIVTGFFGAMPDALIACVGRGYSDLCAALCAVGVSAREVQIWKEVDGIFTADPSKVPAARLLATVTSEEAAELTYYGSEVIHPTTIDIIKTASLPLRLKNVKNPDGAGTIIYPSKSSPRSSSKSSRSSPRSLSPGGSSSPSDEDIETPRSNFMTANGYHGEGRERRVPTALTTKDSISVINIQSNGTSDSQHFLGQTAAVLGRYDIAIDLISSSTNSLSLAVSTTNITMEDAIQEAVAELQEFGHASVVRHLSIVSVVGHKMRNMVGVAGEIFSTLAAARVNIFLISQGANEINISFVVKAQDALLAMDVVHTNVMHITSHREQENNFSKGQFKQVMI
jgi:aspartate kinase